jgi:hypothetical protein
VTSFRRGVCVVAMACAPAAGFSCANGEIDLLPAAIEPPDAAPAPSCDPAAPATKPGPMMPGKMGPPMPGCTDDAGSCPMPAPMMQCAEAGPCPKPGCADDSGDDSSLVDGGAVTP